MGLLTDPRAGNMKIIKFILHWERSLCFLMYIAGIVWMLLLALPTFNDSTYFSENALLPGLVTKESNLEYTARQYHRELMTEMKRYQDGMPYSWILAKFNQLHLDVYTHNFTLNYPFTKQHFIGQNVYGIVRAPRAASTEAIVISVPYRPLTSIHAGTAPSIALLLAFAKFCRKQKYWAKDIIFLVTEHEQLGMQAWLDAYHGVVSGQKDVLLPGDLTGRAGSIQAAINLEFHAMKIAYIDVKVEGLNGQLPNLDLFNLAQNMIKKEDIRRSFQRRFDFHHRDKFKKWWYYFNTLFSMIVTQATGVPTGNHGLFHRYGIEAITLEGFEKTDRGTEANFHQAGKVIESIVRSLNNLLERFHQSYFFYLLPSTDRYISIGLYMPSLVLIIGSLFIKSFSMWLKLQDTTSKANDADGDNKKDSNRDNKNIKDDKNKDEEVKNTKDKNKKLIKHVKNNDSEKKNKETKNIAEKYEQIQVGNIASDLLWCHIFGVAVMFCPKLLTNLGTQFFQLPTEDSIYYGFAVITVTTLMFFFITKRSSKNDNTSLVCVIVLVEVATSIMCIGMHNFSLALMISIIYVPIILLINPNNSNNNNKITIEGNLKTNQRFVFAMWILLHPFMIVSIIVSFVTYWNFPEESFKSLFLRSLDATKKAFVFSIIDSMIYGNWLYNITISILLPAWLLLCNVVSAKTVIIPCD